MKKENGVQIINVHLFSSKSRGKKNKNIGTYQSLPSNPNQREKSIPKPKLFYNSFHQKATNCINYELLINKLLKYIKKTFTENQYLDIKKYIQNEISQLSSSSIDQNESQSSIFNASPPKNSISITENSEMRSVNFGNHSKVIVNKDKNVKKEKKLKLSYDFSNLLTSPKPKPIKIEISNIKKINNQNSSTTPSSKKNNIGTKDIHSLYTIIKKDNQTTAKSNHQKPSKTQSNSKSKSKSTSRDCSNNHYSNTNSNINQNLTNNNNLKKVTTVKQTLITKSQPLLNEKLFSKLNLNNNCQNNPSNCNTITNVRSGNTSSNPKSKIKPKSKVHHQNKTNSNNRTSSKCSGKNNMGSNANNKQIQINSNSNLKKDNKKKQNKTTITLQDKNNLLCYENEKNNQINSNKIKSQYIDLNLEKSSSINNINKNEEMMKQIKNTLDENLKVIFNFSYENFLSKESESESKKSSQQEIMINEQNEINPKK